MFHDCMLICSTNLLLSLTYLHYPGERLYHVIKVVFVLALEWGAKNTIEDWKEILLLHLRLNHYRNLITGYKLVLVDNIHVSDETYKLV